MAQSVESPSLDCSSGHVLRIIRLSPVSGSMLSTKPASDSLSPPLYPSPSSNTPSLSLKKTKTKTPKNQKTKTQTNHIGEDIHAHGVGQDQHPSSSTQVYNKTPIMVNLMCQLDLAMAPRCLVKHDSRHFYEGEGNFLFFLAKLTFKSVDLE